MNKKKKYIQKMESTALKNVIKTKTALINKFIHDEEMREIIEPETLGGQWGYTIDFEVQSNPPRVEMTVNVEGECKSGITR